MAHTNCKIKTITPLTSVVYEVTLIPEVNIAHKAGQYLKVVMGENDARPFSIASPESVEDRLVLQIGAHPDNPYAWEVLEKVRNSDSIDIDAPHGGAYLRDSERPLILLAGGTGFSYAYAILQKALLQSPNRHIDLFWGVRHQHDLYCLEHLTALVAQHPNFRFQPVVEFPEPEWQGLTGWVHTAVMDNTPNLEQCDVYVAGRFEMAKVVRDDFSARGLAEQQLFGDAFEYI